VIRSLLLLRVLAAIDFDGELKSWTIEVESIGADRMLPPKMQTLKLIASQCTPEFAFGVSHSSAEASCARGHIGGSRKSLL